MPEQYHQNDLFASCGFLFSLRLRVVSTYKKRKVEMFNLASAVPAVSRRD